jgi:hypothetical protein
MASGRCQPAGISENPRVDILGSPLDIADDAVHITQIEKPPNTGLVCVFVCGKTVTPSLIET